MSCEAGNQTVRGREQNQIDLVRPMTPCRVAFAGWAWGADDPKAD